jgi:hypothetical protein
MDGDSGTAGPGDAGTGSDMADGSASADGGQETDGGEADGGEFDGGDGGLSDGGTTSSLPTAPCGTSDADGKNVTTAPLVVSELYFDAPEFVEFYNRGPASTDLGDFTYSGSVGNVPAQAVSGGKYALLGSTLNGASGDLAISQNNQIVFYVCWGSLESDGLQQDASALGLWTTPGTCVPTPPSGESLHLVGTGVAATDWHAAAPTPLGCSLPSN